jgi:hypothetical protein
MGRSEFRTGGTLTPIRLPKASTVRARDDKTAVKSRKVERLAGSFALKARKARKETGKT